MKKKCTIAAAVACCFLMPGCHRAPDHTGDASYAVITVSPVDVELLSYYPASIQGRQDIAMYPQVSGTISQVAVREGERVRKGQILFVIDQVPYRAALQVAQANVKAAEAGVSTARLVYDSRQALFNENVISEYDLLTSQNSLLTAEAQLAQAEAQEVNARNNLSYTTVTSPSDGIVGTIPYRQGALVSPSIPKPLTTVSDNFQMYVYFSLTENQLLDLTGTYGTMSQVLSSMPEVNLRLSNGTVYGEQGYIESISGVIDPGTGSASARAVFPNQRGLLHSGASGCVILPRRMNNALVIPASVTFEVQDKVFVYKVAEGKASSAPVDVILTDDGQQYVVTSGLQPGDVIVAEGVGMLRDGAAVTVKTNEREE